MFAFEFKEVVKAEGPKMMFWCNWCWLGIFTLIKRRRYWTSYVLTKHAVTRAKCVDVGSASSTLFSTMHSSRRVQHWAALSVRMDSMNWRHAYLWVSLSDVSKSDQMSLDNWADEAIRMYTEEPPNNADYSILERKMLYMPSLFHLNPWSGESLRATSSYPALITLSCWAMNMTYQYDVSMWSISRHSEHTNIDSHFLIGLDCVTYVHWERYILQFSLQHEHWLIYISIYMLYADIWNGFTGLRLPILVLFHHKVTYISVHLNLSTQL